MQRLTVAVGLAVLVTACSLSACTVDVREGGDKADVDIRTPVGSVSVQTDDGAVDTGLPVYPGSTLLEKEDGPESAGVNVGAFGVGVRVNASKYESTDDQERVLAYYRKALASHGTVTECRGEVDFRDSGPVCEPSAFGRDVQLVTGTKNDQRIVAVAPKGSGSEIGLVHVQLRGV